MKELLRSDRVFVLNSGFRDVVEFWEEIGFVVHMSAFKG